MDEDSYPRITVIAVALIGILVGYAIGYQHGMKAVRHVLEHDKCEYVEKR